VFLPEECEYLIKNAKPRLQRSGVVGTTAGSHVISKTRTSSGMFFARGETEVIDKLEERIAQWVMIDKGQGEGFQVLDYKVWPELPLLCYTGAS
jgi:prolyl 4-hydroxylase